MRRRPSGAPTRTGARSPGRADHPEIVVIGAGVVGAACAAALARAGAKVRVISDPSRSTTRISGGHLLLQSKRPGPLLELARRSLELTARFVDGREEELDYRRDGSLLLARDPEEEEALRSHWQELTRAGVPVEWLTGDDARRIEPALSGEIRAASYCPSDAQVDPAALAGAWLQEAVLHGAALTSGTTVETFVRGAGGQICGVVAGGAEYPARAVVLAAGTWSGELARMAGAAPDIRPRRGVLLRARATESLASRPLLGAGYLTAKHQAGEGEGLAFSFQQNGFTEAGSECVLGGTREFTGWDASLPPELPNRIVEHGARYLPGIRDLAWNRPDVGFRPWSEAGPLIGASSIEGLYLACGHEGDGVSLAAVTAEQIAACLVDLRTR